MLTCADLFCGAGGTSAGLKLAARRLCVGYSLTAINHWPRAVETHQANHPEARHLCASLDSLNPRDLFTPGGLDLLFASPECTHHSIARGAAPVNDQSRSTAWCVTRWAEALRPRNIIVENVPEFVTWGPVDSAGKPIPADKGKVFSSWVSTLAALGYSVDWRIINAADFGDATARHRLFVQARLGGPPSWPVPTHAGRHVTAAEVVDFSLPSRSIFTPGRRLAGLARYMRPGTSTAGICAPAMMPSLATASPFLIKFYSGVDQLQPLDRPLDTITTRDRFALVQPLVDHAARLVDILLRMLQPSELARAMGFPAGYVFTGTRAAAVKQIGNAVAVHTSAALAETAIMSCATVSVCGTVQRLNP